MFFSTNQSFDKYTTNILNSTTPISYKPSLENIIDQFELSIFAIIFKNENDKKRQIMQKINECNSKLKEVDVILKERWEK